METGGNNTMKLKQDYIIIGIVLALVALAAWSRFVPHPANFTALTAVALLSGAILPKRWSVIVPVAAMVLSDIFIGVSSLSVVVWSSFALVALLGSYLKSRLRISNVIVASLVGSTFFYLITNFAVWAEGRMYSLDFSGLIHCYVNALPFYRNMLAGDLVYSGVLFGAYALIVYGMKSVRRRAVVVPAQ
jgi:hypothetical protein